MPINGRESNPTPFFYEELGVQSYMPNSDIAPLSRVDLHETIQKSDKKLLKDMQIKEAKKKYYKDTLVSFDPKSLPKIHASPLQSVKGNTGYFENLNKPILAAPQRALTTLASKNNSDEKSALDNFYDWFIKPVKNFLLGSDEEEVFAPILSESVLSRLSDYCAELEEQLDQMKENEKEGDEEIQTTRQREQAQRARWIKCVKDQLEAQDNRMKHIIEFVTHKQETIQSRQKESTGFSQRLHDKEQHLKPLKWFEAAASATKHTTAGLSGALLAASLFVPEVVAPLAALQATIGAIGGIAGVAQGGSNWVTADMRHELDKIIGELTLRRQKDDSDTDEIKDAMKELEAALKSIQEHWGELSHITEMQRHLTRSMMN